MNFNFEENNPKIRKTVRILRLEPMEGMQVKSSTGMVDNRLFKGDNSLRAIRTPEGLWYFKYDVGALPPALTSKFTKFSKALEQARLYFETRGVTIKSVED